MSQDLESSQAAPLDRERQVLIVEDDDQLAELLSFWINEHSLVDNTITVSTTVEAAMEDLGALGSLDLVLLDRRLPQGMGDELLSTITAEFDPIVLMITGIQPTESLIRLPITDYLVKPIDEAELVERIALLEKLRAAGVLAEYTEARKAALLEYHLDDPTSSPLFRRFASRWDYDRLEVAVSDTDGYVYELYLGDEVGVSISIIGALASNPTELAEVGSIRHVGDVIPTGDSYAWVGAAAAEALSVPDTGYAICEFVDDTPETLIEPLDRRPPESVTRSLESAYQ